MSLIRKLMEINESKSMWFIGILFGSCMPMFLRFIISLDNKDISSFDIKDCLFAGLALNLSSFSVLGSKDFKPRLFIAAVSIFCVMIIASAIGVFLMSEADSKKSFAWLKSISIFFVILSTGISYRANIHLFK